MRSVADHLSACLEVARPTAPLDVVLADAVGCVLAQDVLAPGALPAQDRCAWDGYALRAQDVAGASEAEPVVLEVMEAVRAGEPARPRVVAGGAVLVDSGAPLPRGADAVVPWGRTDRGESRVSVPVPVAPGHGVLSQAGDVQAGETVLAAGERVSSRHVALLAGLGVARVRVHPAPRVVVVPVGDELVEPGRELVDGGVHDANGAALACAVTDVGCRAFRVAPVLDGVGPLREALEDQLVRADVLITTGGLSAGASDSVRQVLGPGGTVRFDQVAMAPGSLMGVGVVGREDGGDGVPVFCLPGDPVAALVAFEAFVRPALRQVGGWSSLHRASVPAALSGGWESVVGLREFVPVRLVGDPASGYSAELTGGPGGRSLSALARANGLAVVPEAVGSVAPGDLLHCLVLDR